MRFPVSTSRLALPLALAVALLVSSCQTTDDRNASEPVHWQCQEVGVTSTYTADGGHVTLAFSGRELDLPIAISASGARYADANGNEFWTKGGAGTLSLAPEAGSETARRECTRSDRPSPWFQAAERGVGFRAVGNEPGWFVEVDRGPDPALRATLDYGERKLELARTETLGGGAEGFSGETDDGTGVLLLIERAPCRDGMSGELFEARATLEVGAHRYHGCGAFLSD